MNRKQIGVVLVVLFTVIFTTHADAAPKKICGDVKDWDTDKPVSGVIAKVEHSSYKSKTDKKKGAFCLDYSPGSFNVVFQKAGYFPGVVPLNLSTKTHFPMETIVLKKAPKVVDIFGKPVQGAILYTKQGFEDPIRTRVKTDKDGLFMLDYIPGPVDIMLEKTGFRHAAFSLNISKNNFPKGAVLVMCPDKFGVYLKDAFIPESRIVFEKAPLDWSGGGGLNIPKVKAPYEGKYYVHSTPVVIKSSGEPKSFYVYPKTAGRLGFAGSPLEKKKSLHLVKVGGSGFFGEFFSKRANIEEVPLTFDTAVERVDTFSHGLAHQRVGVYKTTLNLSPGKYLFLLFERGIYEHIHSPGETGYYFEIQ